MYPTISKSFPGWVISVIVTLVLRLIQLPLDSPKCHLFILTDRSSIINHHQHQHSMNRSISASCSIIIFTHWLHDVFRRIYTFRGIDIFRTIDRNVLELLINWFPMEFYLKNIRSPKGFCFTKILNPTHFTLISPTTLHTYWFRLHLNHWKSFLVQKRDCCNIYSFVCVISFCLFTLIFDLRLVHPNDFNEGLRLRDTFLLKFENT